MQVHLKKNFSYKLRGTIYSIPAPRPGTAKKGTGDGLILREDQAGFARAQKMADARRAREERKMMAGALAAGARGDAGGVAVGSWMDPDWVPEILAVGAGGKGRRMPGHGDLPTIGYGRKNPNERRRKK
jgi:RNA-binding protein NOB1